MGNLCYGIEWLFAQMDYLRGQVQPTDISQQYINQSKEIIVYLNV
jgi:hypothetical protein